MEAHTGSGAAACGGGAEGRTVPAADAPSAASSGAAEDAAGDAGGGAAADDDDTARKKREDAIRSARTKESNLLSAHLKTALAALAAFRTQHPTAHILLHFRQFTGNLGKFYGAHGMQRVPAYIPLSELFPYHAGGWGLLNPKNADAVEILDALIIDAMEALQMGERPLLLDMVEFWYAEKATRANVTPAGATGGGAAGGAAPPPQSQPPPPPPPPTQPQPQPLPPIPTAPDYLGVCHGGPPFAAAEGLLEEDACGGADDSTGNGGTMSDASYAASTQAEVLEVIRSVSSYLHLKPLTGQPSHIDGLSDVQLCQLIFIKCGKWQAEVQLDQKAAASLHRFKDRLYGQLSSARARGLPCFPAGVAVPDGSLGADETSFIRGLCCAPMLGGGLCRVPTPSSKPLCVNDKCGIHCSKMGCEAHPLVVSRRKRFRDGGAAGGAGAGLSVGSGGTSLMRAAAAPCHHAPGKAPVSNPAAAASALGGRRPPRPPLFNEEEALLDSDDEREQAKRHADAAAEEILPPGVFQLPRRRYVAGASAPAPHEPQVSPPRHNAAALPTAAAAAAAAAGSASAGRCWVEPCLRQGEAGAELRPCGNGCLLWYHHLCITAGPVFHEGYGCGSQNCTRVVI